MSIYPLITARLNRDPPPCFPPGALSNSFKFVLKEKKSDTAKDLLVEDTTETMHTRPKRLSRRAVHQITIAPQPFLRP